jgi:hypothetical protein
VDEVGLVRETEPESERAPVHCTTVLDLVERLVYPAPLDDPFRPDAEEPFEVPLQSP